MKILYFTGTGNSLHVAKSLGGEVHSIPQMVKEGRYTFEDEKIGIVCPLYAWSVPLYVMEFLSECTFKCDYLFSVITCGGYSGGVMTNLQSLANKKGFNFDYMNTIKMIDNYLPAFSPEKQEKNVYKKEIEKHLANIKLDIEKSAKYIPKEDFFGRWLTKFMINNTDENGVILKNKGKQKSILLHKPCYGEGISHYYYVDDNCNRCGICAKVCPVDNISLNDDNINLDNKCIMCLSCVHNCPQKAIHLRGESSSRRYRNKNISLNEIIEANQ